MTVTETRKTSMYEGLEMRMTSVELVLDLGLMYDTLQGDPN